MSQQARDKEQGAVDGKTYSTALSLPSWSSLIPEGKVFLDDAGRGGGSCVVETLADEGSPLLAGCFRERQDHRTIVTVAHKGSVVEQSSQPLGGKRSILCAQAEQQKPRGG